MIAVVGIQPPVNIHEFTELVVQLRERFADVWAILTTFDWTPRRMRSRSTLDGPRHIGDLREARTGVQRPNLGRSGPRACPGSRRTLKWRSPARGLPNGRSRVFRQETQ